MKLDVRSSLALAAVVAVVVGLATQPKILDAWTTGRAKVAVLARLGPSGLAVDVDTVRRHVTLHGAVASTDERLSAANAVRGTGVSNLRNLLQVVQPDQSLRIASGDTEIAAAVERVLAGDMALASSRIGVSVTQGTVLLSGTTVSVLEHARAVVDARSVRGVERVESQIESPQVTADQEIWEGPSRESDVAPESGADERGASEAAKQEAGSAMSRAAGAEKTAANITTAVLSAAPRRGAAAPPPSWRQPRTDVPAPRGASHQFFR